ncbi:MAG: glycosyltransferase family 4 protein [Blautia sp.]|nr:glycosyltransferase family 4 protein [Lachnoclostridium sp.]MCM1212199.1 glycosyltransferase family 4 protein [Blautia sp.]
MAEKMKIVLIGPVYPYKGGISHYTGLLYKALVQNGHEVSLHSYKFQYPKFLYKKEQKDERNPQFRIEDTRYSIHTMNPFNWVKTAHSIKKERPDLVIIQWWHPYFAPCYWSLCHLLGRQKILFVCHNVFPHERFPFDKMLTKMVLKQGSYFITQSEMDAADLQSVKPEAKFAVTPHPTYNAFKIADMSKAEARKKLQIDESAKVLLFFGFVREYKGLVYLLEAMPSIRQEIPDIQLWVVGDFGSDRESYLQKIESCNIGNAVKVVEGYIADAEVEKYFAACDLVALPYISATQSGIVQIAYGFDKPVLVTNVGGLPDVVTDGKTGYVIEARSPGQIAARTIDFFMENRADTFITNIKKEEARFSWDTFVNTLTALVEADI